MEAAKELLDEGVIIRPECCRLEFQSPPLHPQERFEHRPSPGVSTRQSFGDHSHCWPVELRMGSNASAGVAPM